MNDLKNKYINIIRILCSAIMNTSYGCEHCPFYNKEGCEVMKLIKQEGDV